LSEETFSNIRTVKAFANTRNEIRKFDEINERVVAIGHRRAVWSGINQTFAYVLLYFTLAAVAYYGVTWSMEGSHGNLMRKGAPLTQGEVVTFIFLVVSLMPNIAFMVPNLSTLF